RPQSPDSRTSKPGNSLPQLSMVQFSFLPPVKLESVDWLQAFANRVCSPVRSPAKLADWAPEVLPAFESVEPLTGTPLLSVVVPVDLATLVREPITFLACPVICEPEEPLPEPESD